MMRCLFAIVVIAGLAPTAPAATAVMADDGYEANVLPGDAGWKDTGAGFLGDYVTIRDGVMAYDGTSRPAPGECGMTPTSQTNIPPTGTIEYRVRCRAIGGDPKKWYQFFLVFGLRTKRLSVQDKLGHYKFDDEHVVHTGYRLPQKSVQIKPPTTTGRWDANEWITIRHVWKDAGDGRYELRSWVAGPTGTHQYLEVIAEYPGYARRFGFHVESDTCRSSRFELDYVRWSSQAVVFGTPLRPAYTVPEIASVQHRASQPGGETTVTIKGGNFDDRTTVVFGATAAANVQCVDPFTITCTLPGHAETGWVDVKVSNGNRTATRRRGIFFGTLPTLSKVEPGAGTNRGGQRVILRGDGFQPGASVAFGRAEAIEVAVADGKTIACTTPPTTGQWHGPIEVTVSNPDDGHVTASGLYQYERSFRAQPKALGWLLNVVDFNLPLAIGKLEEMPFHGVILRPHHGTRVGSGNFTEQDFQFSLGVLQATDFRRFNDNFLHIDLTGNRPAPARGFWEDWTPVLASYRRYARLAREAGFKGFWFDVEPYAGGGPELASVSYLEQGKSLPEIKQQVKKRARQLMMAVLTEYPEITILMSFGPGRPRSPTYDLLAIFCDGLLEAVASDAAYAQARIIDGYENAYYITTPEAFRHAYDRIRKPGGFAYRHSEHPDLWVRFGSAGFGVYPDIHALEAFQRQYTTAMSYTDEYVWFFTNGTFFYAQAWPSLAPGSPYADQTDRYIDMLCRVNGLPRAAPAGRYTKLIDLRMDEGRGDVAKNQAGDLFHGKLSSGRHWIRDTPTLPGLKENDAALDFRAQPGALVIEKTGSHSRSGPTRHMQSSHLGNLYFTDHTIEFSFWWDGTASATDQVLYAAEGRTLRSGEPDTFVYRGRIGAGGRVLEHCQRSHYGGNPGCVAIDLERARDAGVYQFSQWANVAVKVNTVHTGSWRIYLNGREVTETAWAGSVEGRETVEGFRSSHKEWQNHNVPFDLVLAARHSTDGVITDHFRGALDAFRISAGQVPAGDLLSAP